MDVVKTCNRKHGHYILWQKMMSSLYGCPWQQIWSSYKDYWHTNKEFVWNNSTPCDCHVILTCTSWINTGSRFENVARASTKKLSCCSKSRPKLTYTYNVKRRKFVKRKICKNMHKWTYMYVFNMYKKTS